MTPESFFKKPIWSKIKSRLGNIFTLLKSKLPTKYEKTGGRFAKFRGMKAEDAILRLKSLSNAKSYPNYLRYLAAIIAAYYLADTVSLFTASLIPEPPVVPAPQITQRFARQVTIEDYSSIISRNIFNSKGLIPDEDGDLANGPARKTNLPLQLIGTVVLKNELKSIAAIEDKSQNLVLPVRVDDIIEDKLKITKIEHLKVYFINKSTGHLEYVEIIEDLPSLQTRAAGATKTSSKSKDDSGISTKSDNHYEIERNTIDRAMGNISEILTQARAIPNFENGMPAGYKILQVQPGSIYEKLGISNGDVVMAINGEPITDPSKAIALFNDLRTLSKLELTIKRGGRKQNVTYDIGK